MTSQGSGNSSGQQTGCVLPPTCPPWGSQVPRLVCPMKYERKCHLSLLDEAEKSPQGLPDSLPQQQPPERPCVTNGPWSACVAEGLCGIPPTCWTWSKSQKEVVFCSH